MRDSKILARGMLFLDALLVVLLWASGPSDNPTPWSETPRIDKAGVITLILVWGMSAILAMAVLAESSE